MGNKFFGEGNLGQDPELKFTGEGDDTAVCNLRVYFDKPVPVDEGFEDKILVAHDIHTKHRLVRATRATKAHTVHAVRVSSLVAFSADEVRRSRLLAYSAQRRSEDEGERNQQ